jgi:hypothetical protein
MTDFYYETLVCPKKSLKNDVLNNYIDSLKTTIHISSNQNRQL